MKRILLIFGLAGLVTAPLCAQQSDTVYQKREVIIIDEAPSPAVQQSREVIVREIKKSGRRYKRDELNFFSGIGLGYNGLVENLSNLELPQEAGWMDLENKSINFNLSVVDYQYNIWRHFGIRTGLELEVNNYRFTQNITPGLDQTGFVTGIPVKYHLQKTKLVNCYLNVPLLVSIGIGNRNQVELYGGIVGGWRWNSYTKLKSKEHGKDRNRDELNLRNFHYGYTAGITFHNVGFYATYYPHSIFKKDKGPEVRPVSVGVILKY